MLRSASVFLKRYRIYMAMVLLLLIIGLPVIVSLIQQHQRKAHVTAITASPYPANIDFEPIDSYGTYNPSVLSNPNIGAVDVNMNWANVEPQQGVFNWEPADKEIAAWAKQGKKFTIIVRYIKEAVSTKGCTSLQLLPDWEIARIQNFCDKGILIPDYFDPVFIADLKAYIQAIAQHIVRSPYEHNLLYVRIGVGIGGEGFPLMPGGNHPMDENELNAEGYTPHSWAMWQRTMMTYYKSVFPYTTVIYPVNGQNTDLVTGLPVQVENANWAAANGFGVGQQGLRPGTSSPLFQSLRSHYPDMYIQYQTFLSVGSYEGIQADIEAAKNNGAQFIEWYARDAVVPAYQSLFVGWQHIVDSKFGSTSFTLEETVQK